MSIESNLLFQSFDLQGLKLNNRVVMAPLTRCRATAGTDVPHTLNAEYYAQRASAALIISEATQISQAGKGYAWTPGIYSAAQIKGWRLVTDAVHAKGGLIFAQLWHVGRVSHPSIQMGGFAPVAPSAIKPKGLQTFIEDGGFSAVGMPRALLLDEIHATVEAYQQAAKHAIEAGFDGVEIHAANGYLIHQFMSDVSNHRKDAYGGSVQKRLRFAFEVVEAIVSAIGASRTGIRISPVTHKGDARDSAPERIYFPLIQELSRLKLAYVHVIEGETGGERDAQGFDFYALRETFDGAWMVNNGYTRAMAMKAIESGYADLVAFGKPYIANPDLAERFKQNVPLNVPEQSSLYAGGEQGYTDYPAL
ncbi:MAG: alkene reductase [Gammaproteobacteria bacterium]|nr:alkene reductase [Gammaproteobacteria bacterium]MCH9764087.1 alkene reductase [Gammaproteobacteria bacterium]